MSGVLRVPSVGPIVGHTTEQSARVWIRGNESDDSRTIGVAALYRDDAYVAGSARYFRLRREYDRTGIVDFTGLAPDTGYRALTASLSLDTPDPLEAAESDDIFKLLPPPESWQGQLQVLDHELATAAFRTFPAGETDRFSFVFGSCRYPGVLWQQKRVDLIFDSIHERMHAPKDGTDPRFFMMVGDQIYADTLPKGAGIVVADTEAEFHERYVTAFTARNTRRLLASVPSYMILDDHEIEDNWVSGRLHQAGKRALFNMAINAYLSYQWSHGPRNFSNRLYYSFAFGGFPFFVLDERSQRLKEDDDPDLSHNHLLGRPGKGTDYVGQVDVFCDWLVKQQQERGDRPKFVVSASVFVPNEVRTTRGNKQKAEDDSWAAFPLTRQRVLQTIVDHGVQNVVFLSGDIHCSNVAEMSFERAGKALPLKAFSIVSSAFYWPYPFANGDPLDYVHDSEKENDNFPIDEQSSMRYRSWGYHQENNFTQVDLDWAQKALIARTFDKNGDALGTERLALG
jgi:alkaline phosphatase D